MLSTRSDASAIHGRDPIVVLAADDNFAMPLAVTIRSALENLAPDRTLRIYVLDAGIKEETKARLVQSWPHGPLPDRVAQGRRAGAGGRARVGAHQPGHLLSSVDSARVAGRAFASDLSRCRPGRLRRPGAAVGLRSWRPIVPGGAGLRCALHGCVAGVGQLSTLRSTLGSARPVPNFRELGLKPDAAYFNAGILLVDLDAWRRENLSTRMLECLDQHRQHVRWWDQYALNVVLAGRWGQLDPRWNQGSHVFIYPTWEQSPLDRQTFEQMRDDPYIVHYTTRFKPWRPLCPHPLGKLYFEYLDRTAWAGWRPGRVQVLWAQLKTTERRLRHGRKWLTSRARRWFEPNQDRALLDQAPATKSTSTQ